tara:strand:+ start:84 stop:452 length:369 start_codon:yes stop_codon:yes gene_type:complete
LHNLILIAAGGAIGSSLRYFSTNLIKYIYPNVVLGTLFVNIIGSFLIGLLMSMLEKNIISENFLKYFFIVGLLGSYTTFSTFSFEILELLNNRKIFISFVYIVVSVLTCLISAYLGYNLNKL